MKIYDTLIIGQGPAGVSAALYLQRAGFETALIGRGVGALEKAEKIENYYGLGAPISGHELHARGTAQAQALGAQCIEDEIVGLGYGGEAFEVQGTTAAYSAHSVLIATGAARKSVNIKNIARFEGHGVSYCAVCDGFFFKGKNVGVLGAGAYALHECAELAGVVGSVTLLTSGEPAPENLPQNIVADTRKITALEGGGALESVVFEDGETLEISGLFIALGAASASDLARKMGLGTDGRYITVDENMQTNMPGVFAAGDCTGGLLQVAKAVADGANAATAIGKFLRK